MLESTREMFEKGCCDVFDVEMPDVGRPYKLRVFHDDKGRSAGWHLEKVHKCSLQIHVICWHTQIGF